MFQARFWRLRGSVLEGLGMILNFFKTFASFLARCLEDVSSSTPSNDLSHAGRAETSKKAKNLPKSCHGAMLTMLALQAFGTAYFLPS